MLGGRLRVGEAVRVANRIPLGHMRTPWYVRGRTGVVERDCGDCVNPELAAYNRSDCPRIALYRVRFRMDGIWGTPEAPGDTLEVEIYANWLERMEP